MKKYREVATPATFEKSQARRSGNLTRISDAATASAALIIVVGTVCFFSDLPAKLILLAALVPWGLLALGRLLVLAIVTIEEILLLVNHPRDLNRDGRIGFEVTLDEQEPWKDAR